MAKSALDEASAPWRSLVPALPGLCWRQWTRPRFKSCGVECGGRGGPARDGAVSGRNGAQGPGCAAGPEHAG